MGPDVPVALARESFSVLFAVGAPFMVALLIVGAVVGVLQAATQINDPVIGFLPRLLAGLAVAWAMGGWVVERLARFLALALERMTQAL